jgi:hypothetical protein
MTLKDGTIRIGEWSEDMLAEGTVTYPSQVEYKGHLERGKRNGQGELSYSGNHYVGNFRNGLFNGKGTPSTQR